MDVHKDARVEAAFWRAAQDWLSDMAYQIEIAPEMTHIEQIMFFELLAISRNRHVALMPQFRVGGYRADFAIFVEDAVKICVECDGHDYHERSKEQAQRDRERDRYFTCDGWKMLRFTGSEIWRDPRKCVRQVEREIVKGIDILYRGKDELALSQP